MKFVRIFAFLILTSILLSGCSVDSQKELDSKENDSKYKVGDILNTPEKTASFDDIEAITIVVESEDKSFSSINSMKKAGEYVIYTSEINNSIKYVDYQKGDSYTCYHNFDNTWYAADDDSKQAINQFSYLGFKTDSPLVTNGYKKLDDKVIDGKECYVYEVTVIYDVENNQSDDLVIFIDKQTGIWLRSENRTENTVNISNVTSVEYIYENHLNICDPAVISEQTIYDSNDIKIIAKNSETLDPNTAVEIVLEISNNTSSDIKLSSHRVQVNGLNVGINVINGIIKANSKDTIVVKMPSSTTMISDLYTIKNITTRLKIENVHIENSSDSSNPVVDSILLEDTGDLIIKTVGTENFEQHVNKEGSLVFDEKNVKLTFKDLIQLDSGDKYFRFYVENNFTEQVRIRIYVNKINGVEFDDSWRFYEPANSQGFNGFRVDTDELSEFESIDNIEIDYTVYYNDMNDSTVDFTETLTLIKSSSPIILTIE